MKQLSLRATTPEPVLWSPAAATTEAQAPCSLWSAMWEATAAWNRIRTCSPQLEKRPHSSKDQAQLKKRHTATKTYLLFLGNSHLTENPYFYLLNSVILLTIRIPRLKKSAFSLALFDISRYWGRGRLKGRRGDFCYPDQVGIRQFVHSAGERKQSETVLVWGLP